MKKYLVITALLAAGLCRAATYYVDYENGNDNQAGTSAAAAWKHTPSDPAAQGNAKTATLKAGDVVLFKSDVIYRGCVQYPANGATGSPITFKGDGWGPGRAVMDGSEIISTAWTQCASAADCGGNPHWQNIYYTGLPESILTIFTPVYENDRFMWVAQDPNPGDFFNFDRTEYFNDIPLDDPTIHATRTTLTDPTYFTQAAAGYWVGAYVGVWHNPNVVSFRRITAYDPATHTVTFDSLSNDPYNDRDAFYTVLNHLGIIDTAGEFFFDLANNRLYLWPYAADPNQAEYTLARRTVGFQLENRSHFVVEGFKVQKYYGGINWWNQGVGVRSGKNVTVRRCEVCCLRSLAGAAAVGVGTDCLAESNYVHDNQGNIGILGGGTNVIIRANRVSMCSRQGIWFMGATHGLIVDNVVTDILGTHSNPISVYLNSVEILIAGNRVYHSNNSGTIEQSRGLTLYNNFFNSGNSGFHSWSGMTDTYVFNNTFLQGAFIGSEGTYRFKNNITNSGGGGDHTHNIYTGLSWNQTAQYGWYPDSTEITGPEDGSQHTGVDMSTIFASAPRFDAVLTSFNDDTSLHVDDYYHYIVEPGNYLVIDDDTTAVKTVTKVEVLYADGGNRRARITFTPAVAAREGSRVTVWPQAAGWERDYRLKAGGVAVDAGCNALAELPVATFPEYDFTRDIDGNARGSCWDIGAYEYVPQAVREIPGAGRVRPEMVRTLPCPLTPSEMQFFLDRYGVTLYRISGQPAGSGQAAASGVYLLRYDGKAAKVMIVR